MYNNTLDLRRKLYNLEGESGTLPGSWDFLDTNRSVEEVGAGDRFRRTAKDFAIQIQFKDIISSQKAKEIQHCSKLKCLKWSTIITNTIIIVICVGVLSERLYGCLSR